MYGKIFESIYDGTIAVNWKGMIVFQQLIVLSDSHGVVDMTPPAISRRTNIPIDVIEEGLEFLSKPDKYSRSKAHDGKRIIPIDDEREWGWVIVNHAYYRDLASREDKREKDRVRIAQKRAQVVDSKEVSQSVASCSDESQMSPMQDARCKMQNKVSNSRFTPPTLKDIIDYIDEKKYDVSADVFFNHYETNGWMVGRNKMKSWKSAINNWKIRGDKSNSGTNDIKYKGKEI